MGLSGWHARTTWCSRTGAPVTLQFACTQHCCCCCRRRPFLVKGLEATLNKFILSLEFYDEEGRKKIAMGEVGFWLLRWAWWGGCCGLGLVCWWAVGGGE